MNEQLRKTSVYRAWSSALIALAIYFFIWVANKARKAFLIFFLIMLLTRKILMGGRWTAPLSLGKFSCYFSILVIGINHFYYAANVNLKMGFFDLLWFCFTSKMKGLISQKISQFFVSPLFDGNYSIDIFSSPTFFMVFWGCQLYWSKNKHLSRVKFTCHLNRSIMA